MTERHEITTMLQKAFSRIPSVFGEQLQGSVENPAVVKESVHNFSKLVSGTPVKRPAWFFDVEQQGEGLVDITTHLVDLVQWECFPGVILSFADDIEVLGAKRWPTVLTHDQFARVTQLNSVPDYLRKDLQPDGSLHVYANGEIDYRIKGVHAKVRVLWNFEAPAGAGDTHYSVMRGSKANLVIRQGAAEAWQPTLTIEPAAGAADFARARWKRRWPPCAKRIPAWARSASRKVGASSSRSRTMWATRLTSRRSPRSSSAMSRRALCRRGRCRTCSPSTRRPLARSCSPATICRRRRELP